MISKEIEEKIKKYNISKTLITEDVWDICDGETLKISMFKEALDEFLLKANSKEGQIIFTIDKRYEYDSCDVVVKMTFVASTEKTEEQLLAEIKKAELKQQKSKEAAQKRKEKQKLVKEKKEQEERLLYESLKKKYEGT